jgi:hypothetical protein
MAFKNRRLAKRVKNKPCEWCGWMAASRHAAHIIDEKDWTAKKLPPSVVNAMSLCPNCATVFDDVIRPKLYAALREFGCTGLPGSWSKSNKLSDADG